MWIRYASNVAFVALLLAYGASLGAGWSYAEAIPFVSLEGQRSVLTNCAAVALIAWPVWLLHWLWASNDWLWGSETAQYYLGFFTVLGLAASVVIGVQLLTRVLNILIGSAWTWDNSRAYLFGATWSVAFSLAVWAYHGLTWLKYRRRRGAGGGRTGDASPLMRKA